MFTPLFPHLATRTGPAVSYGTAGFRGPVSESSPGVFLRVGLVAGLRALATGCTVGLVVTASHNGHGDNGVKLVDPDGGMLAREWEDVATRVVNALSPQDCVDELNRAWKELGGGQQGAASRPRVVTARDTRAHSKGLEDAALKGAALLLTHGGSGKGGSATTVVDSLGELTTPQLHFVVMRTNGFGFTGEPSEMGYYADLADAYACLVGESATTTTTTTYVDCANGVGAVKFPHLVHALGKRLGEKAAPRFELFNVDTASHAKLNHECGAEHVQKGRVLPEGVPKEASGQQVASFDGDADRIVFYSPIAAGGGGGLMLLDGDKIAALLAWFIKKQLDVVTKFVEHALKRPPTLCCVQTAYANGSSSRYFAKLGIPAPLVKTGVKYLHHKAVEYDVGVYFEANGHGTVIFAPAFYQALQSPTWQGVPGHDTPAVVHARGQLVALCRLLNQATGDAMSDLLAVDGVLRVSGGGMTYEAWDALYMDLPSRQSKVKVPDRTAVKTSEDETKVLHPVALQEAIDKLTRQTSPLARAFVRPSGTEDVVRVYAEAETQSAADALAVAVERAVTDVLTAGDDHDVAAARKKARGGG